MLIRAGGVFAFERTGLICSRRRRPSEVDGASGGSGDADGADGGLLSSSNLLFAAHAAAVSVGSFCRSQ